MIAESYNFYTKLTSIIFCNVIDLLNLTKLRDFIFENRIIV